MALWCYQRLTSRISATCRYSVPDEENVKAALHIRKSRSTEIHVPDFKNLRLSPWMLQVHSVAAALWILKTQILKTKAMFSARCQVRSIKHDLWRLWEVRYTAVSCVTFSCPEDLPGSSWSHSSYRTRNLSVNKRKHEIRLMTVDHVLKTSQLLSERRRAALQMHQHWTSHWGLVELFLQIQTENNGHKRCWLWLLMSLSVVDTSLSSY